MSVHRFILVSLLLLAPSAAYGAGNPVDLPRAILEAERNAPTLAAAAARLEAAEARIKRAWSVFFPRVHGSFKWTHFDQEISFQVPGAGGGLEKLVIQKQDQFNATGTAEMILFDYAFPQLKNAYDAERVQALMNHLARRAVARQAAVAFVQIVVAEKILGLAESDLAFYEKHLEAARARAEQGSSNKLGTLRARQELTATRHARDDRTRSLRFAQETLAVVMDRPKAELTIAGGYSLAPLPPDSSVTALLERAARRREDLKAARLRIDMAERDKSAVWRHFLPTVVGAASYNWSNASGFSGDDTNWNLMAVARWSLFELGRYGDLDEKRAALAEARANVDAAHRSLRLEITQALQALRSARARRAEADELASLARESLDAASKLFDGGLLDYLALFDAKNAARRIELARTQAEAAEHMAHLDLLYVLGLPLAVTGSTTTPESSD